ncbi:MAG: FAD-dependent oxidoreductase [Candidatus Sumerlaeota bacterium]|nr:FAD-dependent oxidoreductase [Candidatus Sumerlaeota bacterium]
MPILNADKPIVILGAGPTGLGAAHALAQRGFRDWMLFERDDAPGGLSRSFRDEHGFTWDLGGHVTFSHYEAYTRLLDDLLPPDQWLYHERESWIRILHRWVPYPFQYNLHRLPPEECAQCLKGLMAAARSRGESSSAAFSSFDDFILQVFGHGIANLFMRPYNRKVWACDPSKLSAGWIGERVAMPDAARVARNVELRRDDVSWGPNNRFRFPLHGGTGAIWSALAARLPQEKLKCNHEAVAVDTRARCVRFANGAEQPYGALISTLPLDSLAAIADCENWRTHAQGLMYSSASVIGAGLRGAPSQELATKCWMYFPEEDAPFYRVTHFSRYSPHNAADIRRNWSLMAEVSESPDRPIDSEVLERDVVRGLAAAGLIESEHQVTHTWMKRIERAYPTPSLGRDAILAQLQPALCEAGIYSRGRFGAWMYEVANMDHSYMQGVECVGYLLDGVPERTIRDPHEVNQSPAPAAAGVRPDL